jgi:uncharacterized protein YlzI (FlbEa/FlbD family)
MSVNTAWTKLIEATGDPIAPIKLSEAHAKAYAMGQMLVAASDRTKIETYHNKIQSLWNDKEIEEIAYTPEFIITLTGLLCVSLEGYAAKLKEE